MSEHFWGKVRVGSEHECWPFLGCRSGGRDGETYGLFTRSRREAGPRSVYAHRMAFCISQGIDIAAMQTKTVIRHKCDNPICCNPAHLEAGTQADNASDMVARGRSLRGKRATNVILNDERVNQIRSRVKGGDLHRVVANDFGVSRAAVSQIISGKNWGWLQSPTNDNTAVTRAAERVTVVV